jgi:hypothetical protein
VPTNTAARAFSDRLGFPQIPIGDPNVLYLGRDTGPGLETGLGAGHSPRR